MKWFKHDSDANMDVKLQEVLLDYGLEGYGLYWYCLELITSGVDSLNLSFELEHDARMIARNTGSTIQKVSEMMMRFVDLGLFENKEGTITCLKLAKRLDKSMTNSEAMRKFIDSVRERHDIVSTCPEKEEEEEEEEEKEEKKKRKKKTQNKNEQQAKINLPNFIDQKLFDEFIVIRKKLGAINTELAIKNLIAKIENLSNRNPVIATALINEAITNSWKSVFPLKEPVQPKIVRQSQALQDFDFSR